MCLYICRLNGRRCPEALPVPGLDGGHALFTLWEIITRRKPSDKFLEVMQYIGLGLLLLLLIYANGNDIIKLFIK